jgi:hypothetical protein
MTNFFAMFFKRKKSIHSDIRSCSLSSSLRLAAAAFLFLLIEEKKYNTIFPVKDLGPVGLVAALDFLSPPDTLGGPQCL